jgi:hypothetical protein
VTKEKHDMNLKRMLLALVASMLVFPFLAQAQGAATGTSTSPQSSADSEPGPRYVKFVWYNYNTKAYRISLVDTVAQKVVYSDLTGTGELIEALTMQPAQAKSYTSSPDQIPSNDNTNTVVLSCQLRGSPDSCAGNVNIPVSSTGPTGGDNGPFALANRIRAYHAQVIRHQLKVNPLPAAPGGLRLQDKRPAQLPQGAQGAQPAQTR